MRSRSGKRVRVGGHDNLSTLPCFTAFLAIVPGAQIGMLIRLRRGVVMRRKCRARHHPCADFAPPEKQPVPHRCLLCWHPSQNAMRSHPATDTATSRAGFRLLGDAPPTPGLRNDQIPVDRYSQTRTLRQVQIPFLVHQRRILYDREAVGVCGNGRVVQNLDPRGVRPRGDGVQLRDGAEVPSAMVRNGQS